jgi:hypothetical protein
VGVWHCTIVERALGDTCPGSAGRARTGLRAGSNRTMWFVNGPPQTHPARACPSPARRACRGGSCGLRRSSGRWLARSPRLGCVTFVRLSLTNPTHPPMCAVAMGVEVGTDVATVVGARAAGAPERWRVARARSEEVANRQAPLGAPAPASYRAPPTAPPSSMPFDPATGTRQARSVPPRTRLTCRFLALATTITLNHRLRLPWAGLGFAETGFGGWGDAHLDPLRGVWSETSAIWTLSTTPRRPAGRLESTGYAVLI